MTGFVPRRHFFFTKPLESVLGLFRSFQHAWFRAHKASFLHARFRDQHVGLLVCKKNKTNLLFNYFLSGEKLVWELNLADSIDWLGQPPPPPLLTPPLLMIWHIIWKRPLTARVWVSLYIIHTAMSNNIYISFDCINQYQNFWYWDNILLHKFTGCQQILALYNPHISTYTYAHIVFASSAFAKSAWKL